MAARTKVRSNDMIDWLSARANNEPVAWSNVTLDDNTDPSSARGSWAMQEKN